MQNVLLQLIQQRHMAEDIHSLLRQGQGQAGLDEEILERPLETVEELEQLSERIASDNDYRRKLVSVM